MQILPKPFFDDEKQALDDLYTGKNPSVIIIEDPKLKVCRYCLMCGGDRFPGRLWQKDGMSISDLPYGPVEKVAINI